MAVMKRRLTGFASLVFFLGGAGIAPCLDAVRDPGEHFQRGHAARGRQHDGCERWHGRQQPALALRARSASPRFRRVAKYAIAAQIGVEIRTPVASELKDRS